MYCVCLTLEIVKETKFKFMVAYPQNHTQHTQSLNFIYTDKVQLKGYALSEVR